MLRLHAPAKVNLFLRVLAREESGFHQLETLFVALEFGDHLEMEWAEEGIVLETGGVEVGPREDNLVYRAAEGYLNESGVVGGVRLFLEKNVPPGGGLGGGSSDAATTLMGLGTLFPDALGQEGLLRLAGALGSDVPFFLSPSSLALAWGRGTRLLPLPPLPSAPVLLALPPIHVSTQEAFRLVAREMQQDPRVCPPGIYSPEDFSSWDRVGRLAGNDFEDVVLPEYPQLARIHAALRETGALFSLLSGSGSSLFGLFSEDEVAEGAKADLEITFPDTRFVLTRTQCRGSGPMIESRG